MEVSPDLKKSINKANDNALASIKAMPEVKTIGTYANDIKIKFGPVMSLVDGAKSGKIPQDLYESFHAEGGKKITDMKTNLKKLRADFQE